MSYQDFQHAATQIIRAPETLLDDPSKFFARYELTGDERQNLDFLLQDQFAQTYIRNMRLIRRRMTSFGIPLTKQILGESLFDYLYLDLFDPQSSEVQTYHLAWAFCDFLLNDENARAAWQAKGMPFLADVIAFERAQTYLRAYTLPPTPPLAKQTILAHKKFSLLDLAYDIPALVRELNRSEHPDFSALAPEKRRVLLLMVPGKDPAHLPMYEIDLETHTFLTEQLKPNPDRIPMPASFDDLKPLGLFREFRTGKEPGKGVARQDAIYQMFNPNAKEWEPSFSPDDTDGILEHYHRFGFVKIKGFYSAEEIDDMQSHLRRYMREVAPTVDVQDRLPLPDKPGEYSLLGRIDYYDAYFRNCLTSNKVQTLAKTLLGGESAESYIQFFNIVPNYNPPTPPHQDAANFRLPAGALINIWVPLQPVDGTNGCLHYVPGSHREGPIRHDRHDNTLVVENYTDGDRAREVRLFAEPGDILVHHGFTLHGSEPNQSGHQRWALGFPYVKANQPDRVSFEEYNELAAR